MPGSVPNPTPILLFIHVDNLAVCIQRGGLHAPNTMPLDGLTWRTTHNVELQSARRTKTVPCGPGGAIHDYVPFYFGPLSPMLLQLKTGRLPSYDEGQEPFVYLVSTAQAVVKEGLGYVFSDGHGYTTFTKWFSDLSDLDKIDWDMVGQRYWADTLEDMDRQRRKQAEFLVHGFLPWELIHEVAVIDDGLRRQVAEILKAHGAATPVAVRRDWYYY